MPKFNIWNQGKLTIHIPISEAAGSFPLVPLRGLANVELDFEKARLMAGDPDLLFTPSLASVWPEFGGSFSCECGVDKLGGGMHSNWCPKGGVAVDVTH